MENKNNQTPNKTIKKKRILSDTYTDEVDRDKETTSFLVREDNQSPEKMHFVNSEDELKLAQINEYLDDVSDKNFDPKGRYNGRLFEYDGVSDLDYNMYTQEIYDVEGSEPTITGLNSMNKENFKNSEKVDSFENKEKNLDKSHHWFMRSEHLAKPSLLSDESLRNKAENTERFYSGKDLFATDYGRKAKNVELDKLQDEKEFAKEKIKNKKEDEQGFTN